MATLTTDEILAHKDYIHSLIVRWYGNHPDLDDMVQLTLIRLWRSSNRYAGRCSVKTWIYTVAKNICRNYFRYKRQHVPIEAIIEPTIPSIAESTAESSELLEKIFKKLCCFKQEWGDAFYLVAIHGMTQAQAAKKLGRRADTVGTWVHRIRIALAECRR